MIALLIGTPQFFGHHCIMVCNNVGYGVSVGEKTAETLKTQSNATVYVHTHVREDAFELYGFLTSEEKQMFETLLTVSGVGPKTALTIADASPSKIRKAVEEADVSFFSSFSRVGKKLAQKIIIELKPKLGHFAELDLTDGSAQTQDVREALQSLGYDERAIAQALRAVPVDALPLQVAIKECMKILSRTS